VNPTLDLINVRTSTRTFSADPITAIEREIVLHAALRAPTAGAMMLYSIIQIEQQALKDRLAETCDDQPFIAKSPWVLVFVADMQRWMDLFAASDVRSLAVFEHRDAPGLGDLMMACSDALIAAQTAVIAAESLGIGSCYIGDVLENAEIHAGLLGLPNHTLPVAMVCFGRPMATRSPTPHCESHVVHTDRYHRLTGDELAGLSAELQEMYAPHGLAPGFANYPQTIYQRKFACDFMAEMNRSVAWWLRRWETPER
jgi:FMN reductase (NADPH)/FMN reductase [NAD(P)H]